MIKELLVKDNHACIINDDQGVKWYCVTQGDPHILEQPMSAGVLEAVIKAFRIKVERGYAPEYYRRQRLLAMMSTRNVDELQALLQDELGQEFERLEKR